MRICTSRPRHAAPHTVLSLTPLTPSSAPCCTAPRAAASNAFTPYYLHIVPYDTVDAILADDFDHGDGTYTIYLLNPPAHAPYAYTYHGASG